MKRTPPPPEPMCLIAFTKWGILRLMDIPESAIAHATQHGWIVVAKDSDVPIELGIGHEWAAPVRVIRRDDSDAA